MKSEPTFTPNSMASVVLSALLAQWEARLRRALNDGTRVDEIREVIEEMTQCHSDLRAQAQIAQQAQSAAVPRHRRARRC